MNLIQFQNVKLLDVIIYNLYFSKSRLVGKQLFVYLYIKGCLDIKFKINFIYSGIKRNIIFNKCNKKI